MHLKWLETYYCLKNNREFWKHLTDDDVLLRIWKVVKAQGSIIFRTHLGQAKYVLHCIFIYSILLITYIVMEKKTRVSLVSFNKIKPINQ